MADKQATVYVVDLGSSTGECHSGRVESNLDYGMKYVWDKIATTMSANKISWSIGAVGFRTEETNNPLDSVDYENISVLKSLGPMDVNHLTELKKKIIPSETDIGDAISAIVVAIHMIEEFTTLKSGKPGKFARKIVLLTDGQGSIDDNDIDPIAQRINEFDIELVVIGVDFDDSEFGFKEEDKSSVKKKNEEILRKLVDGCTKGVFGTAAEAIENIDIPVVKSTRPYATYEGRLSLGDFEKYPDTALYIDVKRFFKTHIAKPPSASSFVTRAASGNGEGSAQSSHTIPGDVDFADAPPPGGDLSVVRNARTYRVNDPSAPGGRRDIEREELAKGYEYGRTAVHISESEENVTKLETLQSFSIIGFIPSDKYEKYLNMGESCITIGQPVNDKARMAFSSLVHALHELESYAVARIVTKDGKDPQIMLMAPSIEPDLEALVDVPLPFAEDVRVYRFPPLDRVITSSGATLEKHRYLPKEDLQSAMSAYVDAMDLSTFGQDDEGQPTEYMPIEDTYAPALHRLNQAIRQRAIHPRDPIAPPAEVLMKWSNPPSELISKCAVELEKLIAAAATQKVPPKLKGKRSQREVITPLSGLDVDSILNREKRQKLSSENSIPGFKQMLQAPSDDGAVLDAANQMSEVIRKLIKNSLGDSKYPQAIENIKTFRAEMIDLEMPDLFNSFIRDLKKQIVKGQLNGDRREFWWSVKGAKLGLIDQNTLEISDVSTNEAVEFLSLKYDLPTHSKE